MPISLQAWLDRSSVRPTGTSRLSAVFEVTAQGKGVEEGARPRARTILSLDVSYSMKGRPLHDVIKSVDRILDAVHADDEIGVVAFSEFASVICEPVRADARGKKLIRSRVVRLEAMSGTNIGAGLDVSAKLLADAPAGMRRGVISLSDGEPNVGASTPEALREIVQKHKPGISFFCLGYGKGSSEDILSAIGDGWEFVPDPATCARAFARALGSQADIVASDVALILAPAAGVEIARISGRQAKFTKEGMVLSLPDMVNGQKEIVVAELLVKNPGADRFAITVVNATARSSSGGVTSAPAVADVQVEIADREPRLVVEAARRVMLVRAEEARLEARGLADKQQWAAAAAVIRRQMAEIAALPDWVANDGSPLAEAYELLLDEATAYERRPDAEQYAMFRKSQAASRLGTQLPQSAKARGDASSKLVMHVAGDMPEAWLLNDFGVRYKLLEENTMGRSKDVEISIQSDSVSRRHAEVFANAGDFWVADMGSTNTTEVNGRRLGSAPHKLVPGDVIRVGQINFRYEEKRRPAE